MIPTAITCLASGVLAVLLLMPATRWLQPLPRHPSIAARRRRARARQPGFDYAAQLDALARQVRTGSSLASAVADQIDRSSPLGSIVDRLFAGGSLVDALSGTVAHQPDLVLTVQALSASAHLGGPVAATLDEAAAVLRERTASRAERRAHGAQARLSARVLTIVPLLFALWSAAASQRTRDIYISTVAGGICALCGLALNLVGWQWMKRIIGPT